MEKCEQVFLKHSITSKNKKFLFERKKKFREEKNIF